MGPSIWQLLIIVLVILLLFGAGRLPRVMEDVAKGIKSFKKGMEDEDSNSQKPAIKHDKNDDNVIDAETTDSKTSAKDKE